MGVEDYLEHVGRWTPSTRVSYGIAINSFAETHRKSADVLVQEIKAGRLDPYHALWKYVGDLAAKKLAPKTIHGYVSSVRGLLKYEGIALDDYQIKSKVGLPPKVESSLDRIPTREELRLLVLNANPRTRALISLLATSGLRIGEAAGLRIGNVDLEKCQVSVMATRTKSRATRLTFISTETVKFLRDYLQKRIDNKDGWLFPNDLDPKKHVTRGELYQNIRRTLVKVGLRKKLDPDSCMYELHPHAFRKYFFTKLIVAGVDRGVAEYLMGHKFGLDNAYLRMAEDRLHQEYLKAQDDFTFLTDTKTQQEARKQIEQLQQELQNRNAAFASYGQQSDEKFRLMQERIENLTEAVQMMQDLNRGKWKWIAPEQVATNTSQTSPKSTTNRP